jgi:hypothetical protein
MRRLPRAVVISARTPPLRNAIKLQDSHCVPPAITPDSGSHLLAGSGSEAVRRSYISAVDWPCQILEGGVLQVGMCLEPAPGLSCESLITSMPTLRAMASESPTAVTACTG